MTEEQGTVCVGCWKVIPEDEDVLYIDEEPYCVECYEYQELSE